jgi:hypothetical protein
MVAAVLMGLTSLMKVIAEMRRSVVQNGFMASKIRTGSGAVRKE